MPSKQFSAGNVLELLSRLSQSSDNCKIIDGYLSYLRENHDELKIRFTRDLKSVKEDCMPQVIPVDGPNGYIVVNNFHRLSPSDQNILSHSTTLLSVMLEKNKQEGFVSGQRKVQNELEQRKKLLQLFAENAPAAIAVFDKNMRYIIYSERYLVDYDLGKQVLTGRSHYEVFPEIPEQWKSIHQRCLAGAVERSDKDPFMRIDGRMDWVKWEIRPWFDSDGDIGGVILFSEIITHRVQAEEALTASEAKVAGAMDMAKLGHWELDVDKGIFTFNDHFYNIFRTTAEQVGGYKIPMERYIREFLHPDDHEIVAKENKKAIDTTDPNYTSQLDHKIVYADDGSTGYIHVRISIVKDEQGRTVKTYGVNQDITQWKLAEERIRKLSMSVEQSPAVVMITDAEGKIEYVNPRFTETTGYTLNEVSGKDPSFLKPGRKYDTDFLDVWNTIKSGKTWKGEFQNQRKNGELYWESALISSLKNKSGKITHFIILKEDITEKKHLMADLIQAKEQAEESDRLKSAFLSNMSHEIRTPMNGIIGFTNLLNMPDFTAEEKTEFSNSLARSTGQLLEIVNNILDISKIEAGQIEVHMTSTCLNNLIRDSVDMFKIRAGEKGLTLQCDFQSNDLQTTIETDETKVIQVINNLLNNAIKFTNSGSVTISTSARSEDILISVEDTGIGIIAEHFHLIFDRFRQVDLARTRQYGGNGLGLSISKSFIEILGGKIWLRSEVDKGTTFYFTLPLTEGTRAIKIKSGLVGPESIPDWIGKSIVVADDDVLVQSFFKEILKKTGAEFHVANNGQNALEYIRRVQAIDLVLLDIKMPDMSGYEVFREIRKELPDIPVIAQTAFAFPEEISEIMTAGFDDILTKPIKIGDLFSICNKLLGH